MKLGIGIVVIAIIFFGLGIYFYSIEGRDYPSPVATPPPKPQQPPPPAPPPKPEISVQLLKEWETSDMWLLIIPVSDEWFDTKINIKTYTEFDVRLAKDENPGDYLIRFKGREYENQYSAWTGRTVGVGKNQGSQANVYVKNLSGHELQLWLSRHFYSN